MFAFTRRLLLLGLSFFAIVAAGNVLLADDLQVVGEVEFQPLAAQAKRVVQALDESIGAPLTEKQQAALQAALDQYANARPARFYRMINEVPTVLMIGIVVLVIVKPF